MIKALAGQKRRRKVRVCKNNVLTWFILGLLVLGINLLVLSTLGFGIFLPGFLIFFPLALDSSVVSCLA